MTAMAAEIRSLACNSCGAPLQVPESTRYVTCRHCGASLIVRFDETAAWTEVAEQLQAGQEAANVRLGRIETRQAIAALDRDWERGLERFRSWGLARSGRDDPTRVGSTVMILLSVLLFGAAVYGAAVDFPQLLLLGIVAGLLCGGFAAMARGQESLYLEARRLYLSRRRQLQRHLESLEDHGARSS